MEVILDTNIYQEDFGMRSGRFQILLDYLRKTQSRITLPKVVYQELRANFERELRSRLNSYVSSKGSLGSILQREITGPLEVDIEKEVNEYLDGFKHKWQILDSEITEYTPSHLELAIERAVRRRKPCNDKGEEIRDAILWQMVLATAELAENKTVVFVSRNTRQFAGADGTLHPDLAAECQLSGVTVRYFPSLDSFAKEHASRVAFVTDQWLRDRLPLAELVEKARALIERYVERYAENAVSSGSPTGYVNMIAGAVDVDSFFVYEMTDGSLKVEVSLNGEVEVECEVERTVVRADWDYDYQYDRATGEYEYVPVYSDRSDVETRIEILQPELSMRLDATVVNGVLTEWAVVDVAV
jgi:hypothetical protein